MMDRFWDYSWFLAVGITTLGVLYFLPKLLAHPDEEKKPVTLRSPYRRTPVGILSTEELSTYNGENGGRILISICGRILDMTKGRDFYGPEGPYHAFAGSDATYLLGAMSTDPSCRNKRNFGQWDESWVSEYSASHPNIKVPYCEQNEFARDTLEGWLNSFVLKYPVVGKLRGFMDVCEESWDKRSVDADLAPGDGSLVIPGIPEKVLSLNELDPSKHISIGGYVFDVNICAFVYCRISGDFPGALGHEISVAIIKDDFAEEWLDQPIVSFLDSNQQIKLESLVHKFRETYPIVGVLKDASKYQTLNLQAEANQSTQVSSSLTSETQESPNKTEEPGKEKDNDNDWDVVQHSDILVTGTEKNKDAQN